jgi:hypothetical protein
MAINAGSLAIDANLLQVFYGAGYFPKDDFCIDSEAIMMQGNTEKFTARIAEESSSPIKVEAAANLPVYHRLWRAHMRRTIGIHIIIRLGQHRRQAFLHPNSQIMITDSYFRLITQTAKIHK